MGSRSGPPRPGRRARPPTPNRGPRGQPGHIKSGNGRTESLPPNDRDGLQKHLRGFNGEALIPWLPGRRHRVLDAGSRSILHQSRTRRPTWPNATQGSVASLWRYPVKSMLGEELTATEVIERGLLGDRAYALVDSADGKAATAKNPRKWPTLFGFRATFIEPPRADASVPPVRITLPNGTTVTSQQADLNQVLSKSLNRTVQLNAAGVATREQ